MPFKKIPDGWMDYTSLGKRIEKTRFVCFKVPLEEAVLVSQRVPDDEWFSPADLLRMLRERNEELGLVIDLTNTNKYYKPEVFQGQGIHHKKILTAGRVVPQLNVTNKFTEYVREFLTENSDNDRLIGIHCTHGLNRTGFVVCRYMVDHMGFATEDALSAFNSARNHEVERQNFIDALHGRSYVDPPMNQSFKSQRRGHPPPPVRTWGASERDYDNWRDRPANLVHEHWSQTQRHSVMRRGTAEEDGSRHYRDARSWRGSERGPDRSAQRPRMSAPRWQGVQSYRHAGPGCPPNGPSGSRHTPADYNDRTLVNHFQLDTPRFITNQSAPYPRGNQSSRGTKYDHHSDSIDHHIHRNGRYHDSAVSRNRDCHGDRLGDNPRNLRNVNNGDHKSNKWMLK